MTVFKTIIQRSVEDESGAITVDWVILTAMIVGLSIGVTFAIAQGMGVLSSNVETELTETEVGGVSE